MARNIIIIGLSGSIGMGKTTVAGQLARFGAKICNADAIVHQLLAKGGAAVGPVGRQFPGVVKNQAVDRKALGEIVFKDREKLRALERILHPLVVHEENRFVEKQWRKGAHLVVLDIPLLFETGAERRCHVTVVASAPPFIQRQRVMKRPGMTEDKFRRINATQMPDRQKRRRADFIVLTGLGRSYSFRRVATLMGMLRET